MIYGRANGFSLIFLFTPRLAFRSTAGRRKNNSCNRWWICCDYYNNIKNEEHLTNEKSFFYNNILGCITNQKWTPQKRNCMIFCMGACHTRKACLLIRNNKTENFLFKLWRNKTKKIVQNSYFFVLIYGECRFQGHGRLNCDANGMWSQKASQGHWNVFMTLFEFEHRSLVVSVIIIECWRSSLVRGCVKT